MSSLLTQSEGTNTFNSLNSKRSPFLSQLRLQLFGLSPHEATFAKRGFQPTESQKQQYLEQIGRTFLIGYHLAIATPDPKMIVSELEAIAPEIEGFAYEGAAMGLALIDAFTPWNDRRVQQFLAEEGNAHIYMGYVGLGWALARIPKGISRYLTKINICGGSFPDPLLGWLAIDGYGFHQGYFYWRDYIERFTQPKSLKGYAQRVFDQGLGRSLWFVGGAEPQRVARTIQHFPSHRHADLWSGVGLACTYAGGVTEEAIREIKALSRNYRLEVAQGSAFAAQARRRAGNLTQHTEQACQILCGVSAQTAAGVTEQALVGLLGTEEKPMYEQWRERIQLYFSAGAADV
jgi:hypothetical protein